MNTTIFFMRHGLVENPDDIYYGRKPGFQLSENGVLQAQQTAEYLSKYRIDCIYTSPLLRTHQTAEIVRKNQENCRLAETDQLLEIRSHMEGMKNSELSSIRADFYSENYRQSGDETMEEILERMMSFCHDVAVVSPGSINVAVSHGDPLMILKMFLQNGRIAFDSIRPGIQEYIHYAEVFRVEIDDAGECILADESFIPQV